MTSTPEYINWTNQLKALEVSMWQAKNKLEAKKKEFAKSIIENNDNLLGESKTNKALFDSKITSVPSEAIKPYQLAYYKALQDYTKLHNNPPKQLTLSIV